MKGSYRDKERKREREAHKYILTNTQIHRQVKIKDRETEKMVIEDISCIIFDNLEEDETNFAK